MEIFIYTLNHPITQEIKYVGKTNNPKRRLYHHIEESKRKQGLKNRRIINWINLLLSQNLKPIMNILEICNDKNWEEKEKFWIKYYKEKGLELCNIEEGGKHGFKNFSTEIKRFHANNLRGLRSKYSEEQKQYIWKLICENYSDSKIRQIFPEISQSFLYQIRKGYKWNHITNISKNRDIDKFKGKGYFYNNQANKWIAVVGIKKKKLVLGRFESEKEALDCITEYRKAL